MKKYGFIGAGNMGGALCKACAKTIAPENIYISDHCVEKAGELAAAIGANASDNKTIAESCDVIFLGVKPQMMADMLSEISDILINRSDVLLVSMAAGLKLETIEAMIGGNVKLIRIMPNTPAGVGEGMIVFKGNALVTEADKQEFCNGLSKAGVLDELDESLFDAATAVHGCGPAFVFLYVKALAKGGMNCGLSKEKALLYAEQVVKGSATLAMNSELDLETLKVNVCSPGGSTIEGVKVIEGSAFDDIILEAVEASYNRNIELGKGK